MLLQQKPLMKALRRSHTSLPSNSPSSSSSWKSLLLVVASSSSSPPISTNRGSLKSPWSQRRRKHVLLPKQWKGLFDADGRFCDGGVKFLKKVRTGGVDPSLKAEVWPFLLGVYDLNSSKEERHSIRINKRKEYAKLRRKCWHIVKQSDRSLKLKGTCGNYSNEISGEFSQVGDSCNLEDDVSAKGSISLEGVAQDGTLKETDGDGSGINCEDEDEDEDEDADLSETDSENSSVFDPSNEPEDIEPFITRERTQETDPDVGADKSTVHTAEDFATWQRIIRIDAVRANDEWIIYSPPSQVSVSSMKARRSAESVGLKDYDHLEACRIFHAARLVAILEAYALYDPDIGYCQGMSDLLSPIISVMEKDHEAFWCFVGFMRKARHNFRLDEIGIQRQLKIVSKIIKGKDSHLYKHLERLQAEDCFFVYRMVVVLFRRELDFEQTLCLWEAMWADQAAIRAGIGKSAFGGRRTRMRAPPTDDLLLYAVAACVLQRRKLIIDKYNSMDEILRECNNMAGHLDVWKLLDDAHDLVVTLHNKI